MKKMFLILAALLASVSAFADNSALTQEDIGALSGEMAKKFAAIPDGQPLVVNVEGLPPISLEMAKKFAAIQIQMPVIDKNGFDLDDDYANAGLEAFAVKATETGLVLTNGGLPLVVRMVSVGTFTSVMEFEVILDGKPIGKFEARKGSIGLGRILLGKRIFSNSFALNTAWFVAYANANAAPASKS